MITVPICNVCNKPHEGRRNVDDICLCDCSSDFHIGEIEEDFPMTKVEELQKKFSEDCLQLFNCSFEIILQELLDECDRTENEGGRILIEWYKAKYFIT